MTPTTLHIISPTLEVIPLALAFASRVLLTEKASAMTEPGLSASLPLPVNSGSVVSMDRHGYNHYGIND